MNNFSIELAQSLYESTDLYPISFDDGWQWLEYSRKDTAKRNFLNCGFTEGIDFELRKTAELRPQGGLSNREDIRLTCECFKQWAMMSGTDRGRQVRLYFLECEKAIKKHKTPQTFAEALQLAADQAKQLEEQQALIASLESENHQLSEAVDELFNYSSIIRVAKFNNCGETNFHWRRLKTISEKMGVEVKRVPCPRFEYKNLYSHDVWRVAYPSFRLPETTTLVIYSGDSK